MFARTIPWLLTVLVASVTFSTPATAQSTYATIRSVHFDVRYMPGVPDAEAKRVLEFLQSEYDTLRNRLGLEPKAKLEVRIYDSPARFRSEINMARDVLPAMYVRGILHVLEPMPAEAFGKVMRYQLSRVFLEPAAQFSCPVWLREAFAVNYSGRMVDLSPPGSVVVASFADLSQDLEEAETPVERNDIDFVLRRTMQYFVQKYGEPKADSVFKEFTTTRTIENVFKKVFGEDFQNIEKDWAKFVAIKPRKAK